jgi:patatin-like phospholipase/acyl hydrolase
MAIYLGKRKQGDLILFRSAQIPTRESHGHRFTAVIGPFRSKVGASFFARYGRNNPHIRTADDAERLARADPRMEQAILEESMTDEELTTARECEAQDQFEFQPPIQQGAIPCPITLNINA